MRTDNPDEWQAQAPVGAYPNRPVRLVVPYAPGGNIDITGRIVAPAMSDALGVSFVVDNRAGAGGAIGSELVAKAWDYFKNVQTKDMQYKSFLRPEDKPAIWLNKETMEKYRPQMQKLYYDASKYNTYLEQLGIKYPTVR